MRSRRTLKAWILRSSDGSLPAQKELELERALVELAEEQGRDPGAREILELARRAAVLEEAFERLPEPPVEHIDVERAVLAVRRRIDAGDVERARSRPGVRALAVAFVAALAIGIAWLAAASDEGGDATEPRRSELAVREAPEIPEPAEPEPPSLDMERLAAARGEVRRLLADAAPRLPLRATREEVRAFADELELAAGRGSLSGWPLERLVGRVISGADEGSARCAIRYIGLCGDRLSLKALAVAGPHPSLEGERMLAWIDAGPRGREGLARALLDPLTRIEALAAMQRLEDGERAEVLAHALRGLEREAGEGSRRELTTALANLGPVAAPLLLDLGEGGRLDAPLAVEALAGIPGAGALLANRLGQGDVRFHLAAVRQLQPEGSLAWTLELCRARATRDDALWCLSGFRGRAALVGLVRLWSEGFVDLGQSSEVLEPLLPANREVVRTLAEELARDGPEERALELLEFLVDAAHPDTAPGLGAFAASDGMDGEDRVLAAAAIGEVCEAGDQAAAEELGRVLSELGGRDRRLAATCLLSLFKLSGEEGVRRALSEAPERVAERALELLVDRDGPSVSVVRLARVLQPALALRAQGNQGIRP